MASGGGSDNALAVQMYKQATDFLVSINPEWNTGKFLYRNKSREYFAHIKQSGGLMSRYTKDNNGDPDNPMNAKITGIFFMANVRNGTEEPPDRSPFGAIRFDIPIDFLLQNSGQKMWRLFFADFFCMNREHTPHYVTVVMCETGTEDHRFCDRYLKPLPEDNPFFRIAEDGKSFRVSSKIWIEVFYMKDIDIREARQIGGAKYETVEVTGSGLSANGIPKPSDCPICNRETNQVDWQMIQSQYVS